MAYKSVNEVCVCTTLAFFSLPSAHSLTMKEGGGGIKRGCAGSGAVVYGYRSSIRFEDRPTVKKGKGPDIGKITKNWA